MKKILLATTMLASVSGYAVADVAVSGDARMGVVSSEGNSAFDSRVRVKFSGSGTTDTGLSFGGSFRANDAAGANSGTAGSVFISGAFGKISMGDVDGGDQASVGQLASVGYTGLDSGNSVNYVSDGGDLTLGGATDFDADYIANAGGSKVLYSYTAGDLTVNASSGQISNDLSNYGVGASYTTGGVTMAVGYGHSDIFFDAYDPNDYGDVTDTSASVTYVMGATTVKAIYQDKEMSVSDGGDDASASAVSMGVSVQHKIDSMTLTAYSMNSNFTGIYTYNSADESATANSFGIGVSYDLGGGASVSAGWATVETFAGGIVDSDLATTSSDKFDAGVSFSF